MFEALIYIALFAVVIGGGVISAYNIFEGSASIKAKAQQEMELNFVMRKLDWALNGLSSSDLLTPPQTGGQNDELLFWKGSDQYHFKVDSGTDTMYLVINGNSHPLTSDSLNITDINFQHVVDTPNILNITMTVNGEKMSTTTRYVRTD